MTPPPPARALFSGMMVTRLRSCPWPSSALAVASVSTTTCVWGGGVGMAGSFFLAGRSDPRAALGGRGVLPALRALASVGACVSSSRLYPLLPWIYLPPM